MNKIFPIFFVKSGYLSTTDFMETSWLSRSVRRLYSQLETARDPHFLLRLNFSGFLVSFGLFLLKFYYLFKRSRHDLRFVLMKHVGLCLDGPNVSSFSP